MPQDIAYAADLIEKMLDWVPNNRISCEEALKHPFFK
jgi:serine/threonine protein kinase